LLLHCYCSSELNCKGSGAYLSAGNERDEDDGDGEGALAGQ